MSTQTTLAKDAAAHSKAPTGLDAQGTVYRILIAISLVHLFNDSIQSVIPAIFPILKDSMHLTYTQIGWIAFAINFTASIMQPVVGWFADKKPTPAILPVGMGFTFTGMLLLAFADSYVMVLISVIFVGLGSAAFHPEGSRVSHMAAGPRRGLAQSIFQVGGNAGQSLAPLLTRWIFIPFGLFGAIGFTGIAAMGIAVQLYVARWYGKMLQSGTYLRKQAAARRAPNPALRKKIAAAITILILLVFVRSWYVSLIGSFYAFNLKEAFALSTEDAQIYIFLFLAAGALGTFFGGPLADRFGKRNMIFLSMAGAAPLALLLPYANLFWTGVLLTIIGFIMLSSFSVTVVYAQMLIPGKIGTVSGLITGLAFGMGGIGALVLGNWIDAIGVSPVMQLCSFLPLIGIFTFLLPSDKLLHRWAQENGSEE
ncbi:MFS transporter [Paenibacillus silvae]|uniref:MFS transporter n=1 Tax=Paenibacillus silvae TaxID=1325358 RepID=A0ABQ1ZBP3_9BACL|nr:MULTISPECIES: MFS transporter [Paenibacillus]MCK6077859.1 MFS transporter [Paenibacillus silvae]MCK6152058.1 MFS transporter [Paenibacillus silvae]MCK6270743.1 MFS transporter [Paenibacillus silvae]GGH56792.1 MFS transporter [Paenibacillus silvae]